jgi:hypothetical protein
LAGIPKEVIKTHNRSDLYIELYNGSKIHGLPLDDPKKLENYNLGLFMIDQAEEVEEDIFLKFHGRLRQHRCPREGILLFNPNGHNWLWKRFIDEKRRPIWKGTTSASRLLRSIIPTFRRTILSSSTVSLITGTSVSLGGLTRSFTRIG